MKIQIFTAIAGLALAASPASAVITSITLNGNGVATSNLASAPTSVQTLSGLTFHGFTEVSNLLVVGANATRPLVQAAPTFPVAATRIPSGTTVSSHFFVFAPGATRSISGTITFNQNIIGVQRSNTAVNAAASTQLRAAGTTYALTNAQGFEAADSLTFVNAKTLNFSLSATAANSDMFAVITSVPEPATWAMLVVGFGLVGFARRRRATAVAA